MELLSRTTSLLEQGTKAAAMTSTEDLIERSDLQDALEYQRRLLRLTFEDLPDQEAARITPVDPQCIGELVKEITDLELGWLDFALAGVEGMIAGGRRTPEGFTFDPRAGDTVAGLLRDYNETTYRTERILATNDLDISHPLPAAPEIRPGLEWTARRAVLQVIAATARVVGRADRIRRALDDARERAGVDIAPEVG
jgi:hypothetical protein